MPFLTVPARQGRSDSVGRGRCYPRQSWTKAPGSLLSDRVFHIFDADTLAAFLEVPIQHSSCCSEGRFVFFDDDRIILVVTKFDSVAGFDAEFGPTRRWYGGLAFPGDGSKLFYIPTLSGKGRI